MSGRGRGLIGKYAAAFATILLLGSCGPLIPPGEQPRPPAAPVPASALLAGIAAGPSIASYGLAQAKASAALASFQQSCPQLLRREIAHAVVPDLPLLFQLLERPGDVSKRSELVILMQEVQVDAVHPQPPQRLRAAFVHMGGR